MLLVNSDNEDQYQMFENGTLDCLIGEYHKRLLRWALGNWTARYVSGVSAIVWWAPVIVRLSVEVLIEKIRVVYFAERSPIFVIIKSC